MKRPRLLILFALIAGTVGFIAWRAHRDAAAEAALWAAATDPIQ